MRTVWAVWLVFGLGLGAGAQLIPANGVIPQPPPTAPIREWTDGPGRFRVELDVDGAKLRGWDYKPSAAGVKAGSAGAARRDAQAKGTGSALAQMGSAMGAAHDEVGAGADKDVPVIVFFNGNAMTVYGAEALYEHMARLGAEVVVYDYRGYGFSEGTADVEAFRRDALSIFDKVVREYPGRRVVVYGYSLGTAMATHVAAERTVGGLVLAAAFASAAEELPVFARRMGLSAEEIAALTPDEGARLAFDEVAMVREAGERNAGAPLLMLHGRDDTLVPMEQGREVFQASPVKQKKFVEIPGADHRGTVFAEGAFRALGVFLAGR